MSRMLLNIAKDRLKSDVKFYKKLEDMNMGVCTWDINLIKLWTILFSAIIKNASQMCKYAL